MAALLESLGSVKEQASKAIRDAYLCVTCVPKPPTSEELHPSQVASALENARGELLAKIIGLYPDDERDAITETSLPTEALQALAPSSASTESTVAICTSRMLDVNSQGRTEENLNSSMAGTRLGPSERRILRYVRSLEAEVLASRDRQNKLEILAKDRADELEQTQGELSVMVQRSVTNVTIVSVVPASDDQGQGGSKINGCSVLSYEKSCGVHMCAKSDTSGSVSAQDDASPSDITVALPGDAGAGIGHSRVTNVAHSNVDGIRAVESKASTSLAHCVSASLRHASDMASKSNSSNLAPSQHVGPTRSASEPALGRSPRRRSARSTACRSEYFSICSDSDDNRWEDFRREEASVAALRLRNGKMVTEFDEREAAMKQDLERNGEELAALKCFHQPQLRNERLTICTLETELSNAATELALARQDASCIRLKLAQSEGETDEANMRLIAASSKHEIEEAEIAGANKACWRQLLTEARIVDELRESLVKLNVAREETSEDRIAAERRHVTWQEEEPTLSMTHQSTAQHFPALHTAGPKEADSEVGGSPGSREDAGRLSHDATAKVATAGAFHHQQDMASASGTSTPGSATPRGEISTPASRVTETPDSTVHRIRRLASAPDNVERFLLASTLREGTPRRPPTSLLSASRKL